MAAMAGMRRNIGENSEEGSQRRSGARHLSLFFGLYALVGVPLYYSAYSVIPKRWSEENHTYCLLVLPVVCYLLWEKRLEFRRVPAMPSWGGLALVVVALFFFWVGELGGEFYTLYFSSWLLCVGLALLHLGPKKLKVIAFPCFFALAVFPLPNVVFSSVSLVLKLVSSNVGVWMLSVVGLDAFREGNVIDLGFTQLQVVDACSGLRYLIPLLFLGLLVAHYFRAPVWQKALLVLSTIPLTVLTNSLRIASVGFLYQFWGKTVAEGFFHDFSGWLIFMFTLALLLGEAALLKSFFPPSSPTDVARKESRAPAPAAEPGAGQGVKKQLLLFAAASLVIAGTLLISHAVQFRDKVPMAEPLWRFPMEIAGWRGTRSGMEPRFLVALKLTDYLLAEFRNSKGEEVSLYVSYTDSQRKGESAHSPASCLPASGWMFEESGAAPLPGPAGSGSKLSVNRAFMRKDGERLLVYYWFPQRGRMLRTLPQLKFYAFWDALTRRRTDGGMVRLMTPVYESEGVVQAEARLATFAGNVLPLLQKFLPN